MRAGLRAACRGRGALLPGLVCCFSMLACTSDTETTWLQYNAENETVTIEVGDVSVDDAAVTLHSNTGEVSLGTGTVTPAAGPVGTIHEVVVEVSEDYASDIGRVSVRLDAGDRGEDEYDLDADATGEGYWVIQLTSVGEPDEVRSDLLTFRLWTAG